jgi:NAD(P)H-hydrate epimerase
MRTISPDEMRAIDANCSYLGLLPLQLMENAGAALAKEVRKRAPGRKIAVVAGKGNNGGDALVAARHLADFDVTVFLIGRSRDIATEEARRNWEILERLGFDLREVRDSTDLESLSRYDLILDAVFGTGVKGSVRGLEAEAIDAINASNRSIISVDVPSGIGTDRSVNPGVTVTFHRPKEGIPGDVVVATIGIPPQAEFYAGPGDLALVTGRAAESHKGQNGRVLVIGGGPYSGAPALSAMAALRAGADLVTVAAPENVSATIAGYSPNLIVRPLSDDHLSPEDLGLIRELLPHHDVVVAGMGLGRHPETRVALAEIVPECERVVLDADALLPGIPLKGIITPHESEFRRVSTIKLPPGRVQREVLMAFARDMKITILLKGEVDLITDGDVIRGNATGNPGMTVGGTGDVLAGITGAFYARAPPMRAAVAAAFVNGTAGDLACQEKGYSLLATDVIEKIPAAMNF